MDGCALQLNEPSHEKICLLFLTRSDTNCAVQPQNMGLKRLEISDLGSRGIAYLCSENKGADNHAADLRL